MNKQNLPQAAKFFLWASNWNSLRWASSTKPANIFLWAFSCCDLERQSGPTTGANNSSALGLYKTSFQVLKRVQPFLCIVQNESISLKTRQAIWILRFGRRSWAATTAKVKLSLTFNELNGTTGGGVGAFCSTTSPSSRTRIKVLLLPLLFSHFGELAKVSHIVQFHISPHEHRAKTRWLRGGRSVPTWIETTEPAAAVQLTFPAVCLHVAQPE